MKCSRRQPCITTDILCANHQRIKEAGSRCYVCEKAGTAGMWVKHLLSTEWEYVSVCEEDKEKEEPGIYEE